MIRLPSACWSTSDNSSTGYERHRVANFLRNVLEIRLVSLGQQHLRDARTFRAEHLLLEAADREHLSGQRDLAGHRQIRIGFEADQHRRDRRRHRDAGATVRPSEPLRPGRECECRAWRSNRLASPSSLERERRNETAACALSFITSPSWPVSDEFPGARHRLRLDEDDVAADRRPDHAGRDADRSDALLHLVEVARALQILDQILRLDRGPCTADSRRSCARSCGTPYRSRVRDYGRRPRACSR